jgi:glyoxylase-like metal-dependent hydrolase (beta-lactamase superfamily II)
LWLFAGAMLALAVAGCANPPKTASSVVAEALAATGDVGSIQFAGTGMSAFVGQPISAGQEWPRRDLDSFTATIDYDQQAARYDLSFARPTFGGQQQNTEVHGDKAWSTRPTGPVPQPTSVTARQLQILLTPHGFLKGAMAARDAKLAETDGTSIITYTALGRFPVKGTIDNRHLVTKVETRRADPVLGDAEMVATFSDYKTYNGIRFPARVVVSEGGFTSWEFAVDNVIPNAPLDLPVPETVQSAPVQSPTVVTTKLGDGLWFLGGSSHHSLVVEFKDYVAVIEAPQNEERSLAVMAEARRLAPGKPIKYVLTTHHHFDHIGGLRTYAAEGITVITHQANVAFLQQALTAPATIEPDLQTEKRTPPRLEGVSDKYVLTDGQQTIEVYPTDGDSHTSEYTLIYLPKQRVLVEADAFSPGPLDAPPPATPEPDAVKLNAEIQRLGLSVETIAPIHGRGPAPLSELKKFIGA